METKSRQSSSSDGNVSYGLGVWSTEEHRKFAEALRLYPEGPWRAIARYVGTRSVRQVQSHARKCQEKAFRHLRGLRKRYHRYGSHYGHHVDGSMLVALPLDSYIRSIIGTRKQSESCCYSNEIHKTCGGQTKSLSKCSLKTAEKGPQIDSSIAALPTLGESIDFFTKIFYMEEL